MTTAAAAAAVPTTATPGGAQATGVRTASPSSASSVNSEIADATAAVETLRLQIELAQQQILLADTQRQLAQTQHAVTEPSRRMHRRHHHWAIAATAGDRHCRPAPVYMAPDLAAAALLALGSFSGVADNVQSFCANATQFIDDELEERPFTTDRSIVHAVVSCFKGDAEAWFKYRFPPREGAPKPAALLDALRREQDVK